MAHSQQRTNANDGISKEELKDLKRPLNNQAMAGLIEEIKKSRRDLSPATINLISALESKIEAGVLLTSAEKTKIEGIYSFMCRDVEPVRRRQSLGRARSRNGR